MPHYYYSYLQKVMRVSGRSFTGLDYSERTLCAKTDIPLILSGYGSFLLRCVCHTVSAVVVVVARPSAILPHCCFHSFFCRCSKKCFCRSYKTLKVQRCLPVHDVVSFEISIGESGIVASHYCLREEENTRSPVRSRLGSANSTDTCAP